MMPLMFAEIGREVVIEQCRIKGDLKRHVENLGLLPGERVTPVSSTAGNLIVKVKESRFAINVGLASKIFVS